jgi:branched-chain amino acid transport system ATP-binding protein
MTPTLELKSVRKSFGGLNVLQDIDLTVAPGEIVSVIGPNGAGKTTLFNVITGVYTPDSGDILLDGKSIVGLNPAQIANRGAARTFQTLRVFLNMTVRENVMAAAFGQTSVGPLASVLRKSKRWPKRSWPSSANDSWGTAGTSPHTASRTQTGGVSR